MSATTSKSSFAPGRGSNALELEDREPSVGVPDVGDAHLVPFDDPEAASEHLAVADRVG